MKKLLLILLCVPMIGFGQKAPPSVLSTTNTTFLYAGIANPVEIGVEGKLNKNLFVTYEHYNGIERVLETVMGNILLCQEEMPIRLNILTQQIVL